MRHLLTVIVGTILSIVLFMTVDWRDIDFTFSTPSRAAETTMEVRVRINNPRYVTCSDRVSLNCQAIIASLSEKIHKFAVSSSYHESSKRNNTLPA